MVEEKNIIKIQEIFLGLSIIALLNFLCTLLL